MERVRVLVPCRTRDVKTKRLCSRHGYKMMGQGRNCIRARSGTTGTAPDVGWEKKLKATRAFQNAQPSWLSICERLSSQTATLASATSRGRVKPLFEFACKWPLDCLTTPAAQSKPNIFCKMHATHPMSSERAVLGMSDCTVRARYTHGHTPATSNQQPAQR